MRMLHMAAVAALTLVWLACAPAVAETYSDAVFPFEIDLPDNWSVTEGQDGRDRLMTALSPDENLAVRVRAVPLDGPATPAQLRGGFESYVLRQFERLAIEPMNHNGLDGEWAAYRGLYEKVDVVVGAFFTIQGQNGYILWSMTPFSVYEARSAEADQVLNTFRLAAGKYRLYREHSSGIQFEVPAHWNTQTLDSGGKNGATFSGLKGTPEYVTTINLQVMARSAPGYADLAESVRTLERQVLGQPDARIEEHEDGEIGGMPAHATAVAMEMNGEPYLLRHFAIERPDALVWITFIAPVRYRDLMRPHYQRVLQTLRPIQ